MTTSISFYADARCTTFAHNPTDETITAAVRQSNPHVLLLYRTKHMKPDRYAGLIDEMKQFGLEPVSRDELPAGTDNLRVLARPRSEPRLARGRTGSGGGSL